MIRFRENRVLIWPSLLSDLEARDEEKRKMVLVRIKKIESEERKIKKETKSMNKVMEMILSRKQRALKTISREKSCVVETMKLKTTVIYYFLTHCNVYKTLQIKLFFIG